MDDMQKRCIFLIAKTIFNRNMNYNLITKTTKIQVLKQQIKRTKHTVNQSQQLLKLLIQKVDAIQMAMINWFETNKDGRT